MAKSLSDIVRQGVEDATGGGLGFALFFAVVTAVGASPPPPPIIVTTKSSPMCQTLREKIAPAIQYLVIEDRMMSAQHPLATSGRAIIHLADNWIDANKLLNPDTFFHSDDVKETQAMSRLRARLQKVVDDENASLNVLSGAEDTADFEALLAAGTKCSGVGAFPCAVVPPIYSAGNDLSSAYAEHLVQTQRDELQVFPALAPIIERCR